MPSFETERLLLRPPEASDANAVARWLGDFDVSRNMAAVPYPFSLTDAEALIAKAGDRLAKGEAYAFAIEHKQTHELLGMVTLRLSEGFYKLSCWLGRPYWDFGYATEATRKIAGFAFNTLKAETVLASWFDDNAASGRMLTKLGFEPVGDYHRESLARGEVVLCHRMALHREAFGRKRSGVRRLEPELVEA